MAQYFSKSQEFVTNSVWLTNDLSVVVPSDNSHDFLIDDWVKLRYIEISFVSLQQAAYFSSHLLNQTGIINSYFGWKLRKISQNLNMIWSFSSFPNCTYSILYVAINYVHNYIWKTGRWHQQFNYFIKFIPCEDFFKKILEKAPLSQIT